MTAGLSYITLAVADLDRALKFYQEGFGLELKKHHQNTNVNKSYAFFDAGNGLTLALYPRRGLTQFSGASTDSVNTVGGALYSYNVASRQDVFGIMSKLQRQGATITRSPCTQPWGGYAGYLKDLDGHMWEIVWNENQG